MNCSRSGRWLIGLWACTAIALLPVVGRTAPPADSLPAEAEQIGDGLYRIGKVKVDLNTHTLTCAGKVNMQRGTIEYLAVAPEGKIHESVLTLNVRPLHLQVGLILMGLEPMGGLRYQGDKQAPKGAPVNAYVSWKRAGRTVKVRAEELVWDVDKKRSMPAGAWVFSGSSVDGRGFVADRELSLIATYRDPAAIVNNALPTGSDDSIYKVNERIVPRWDTPVTFTFTPAARPL